MQDGYISLRAFGRAHGVRLSAVQKAIKTKRVTDVLRNARGFVVGIHAENAWLEWQRNTDQGEAAKSGKIYQAATIPTIAGGEERSTALSFAETRDPLPAPQSSAEARNEQRLNASAAAAGVLAEPSSQEGDIPARAAGQLPLDDGGESSAQASSTPAAAIPGFMEHKTEREKFLAKTAELDYLKQIGALVSTAEVEREVEEIFAVVKSNAFRIIPKKSAILAAETDPGRIERLLTEALTQAFHESSRAFADVVAGGVEERATAMP